MSKSKTDKKVNRLVRNINKQLKDDVFGDRFWVRQMQKAKVDGMEYYLYEMKDRLEPNRDSIIAEGWIWGSSHFFVSSIYEAMNDFIVRSSFWSKYYDDSSRYDYDLDFYAHLFYHYHTKEIDK